MVGRPRGRGRWEADGRRSEGRRELGGYGFFGAFGVARHQAQVIGGVRAEPGVQAEAADPPGDGHRCRRRTGFHDRRPFEGRARGGEVRLVGGVGDVLEGPGGFLAAGVDPAFGLDEGVFEVRDGFDRHHGGGGPGGGRRREKDGDECEQAKGADGSPGLAARVHDSPLPIRIARRRRSPWIRAGPRCAGGSDQATGRPD